MIWIGGGGGMIGADPTTEKPYPNPGEHPESDAWMRKSRLYVADRENDLQQPNTRGAK